MASAVDILQISTLALVTLLGALLQSAFGFGFAIFAVPIFLGVLGTHSAIQVLVVLHVVLSAIVVPRVWQFVPLGLLRWLIGGSLLGFPIGLVLFLWVDIRTLKLAVGVATIVFSLLLVKREWSPVAGPQGDRAAALEFRGSSALAVGLLSGAMTAILVMPGPVAMLYLRALGLEKQASRAASLAFFAFCYVVATGLHATFAGMTGDSWRLAALLAPAVLAGSLAGNAAARHLSEERFRRSVVVLLIVSGIYAVWTAVS